MGLESTLIYSWSLASGPGEVTWSSNNTNEAKQTTAIFTRSGLHRLQCRAIDASIGMDVVGDVLVDVHPLTIESMVVSPSPINGANAEAVATVSTHGLWPTENVSFKWTSDDPFITFSRNDSPAAATTTLHFSQVSNQQVLFCTASCGGFTEYEKIYIHNEAVRFTQKPLILNAKPINPIIYGREAQLSTAAETGLVPNEIIYTWTSNLSSVTFSPNASSLAHHATATFKFPGTYEITCTAACGGFKAVEKFTVINRMLAVEDEFIHEKVSEPLTTSQVMKEFSVKIIGDLSSAPYQVSWKLDGVAIDGPGRLRPDADPAVSRVRCLAGPGQHVVTCVVVQGTVSSSASRKFTVENAAYFSLLDKKSWVPGANVSSPPSPGTFQRATPGLSSVVVGQTFPVQVKGPPGAPVVFVALRGGVVAGTGLMTHAALVDGDGFAKAEYVFRGEVMEVLALSGSDRIRFVIYKK